MNEDTQQIGSTLETHNAPRAALSSQPSQPVTVSKYEQVKEWVNANDCDIFIYSGRIGAFEEDIYISERFVDLVERKEDKRKNACSF